MKIELNIWNELKHCRFFQELRLTFIDMTTEKMRTAVETSLQIILVHEVPLLWRHMEFLNNNSYAYTF